MTGFVQTGYGNIPAFVIPEENVYALGSTDDGGDYVVVCPAGEFSFEAAVPFNSPPNTQYQGYPIHLFNGAKTGGKADVGWPLVALATVDVPSYAPDEIPPELAALPAEEPGSKRLRG